MCTPYFQLLSKTGKAGRWWTAKPSGSKGSEACSRELGKMDSGAEAGAAEKHEGISPNGNCRKWQTNQWWTTQPLNPSGVLILCGARVTLAIWSFRHRRQLPRQLRFLFRRGRNKKKKHTTKDPGFQGIFKTETVGGCWHGNEALPPSKMCCVVNLPRSQHQTVFLEKDHRNPDIHEGWVLMME